MNYLQSIKNLHTKTNRHQQNLRDCMDAIANHADEEVKRLKIALQDTIQRPMGVVPDSAGEFYDDYNGRVK